MRGGERNVFFGVAGWSYPDWRDTVYRLPSVGPRQLPLFDLPEPEVAVRRERYAKDPLAFLSGYLDMVEVNSSFYRTPSRKTVEQWGRKVQEREGFFFTAKLHQLFTHQFSRDRQAAAQFCHAFEPLAEDGRLHGILAQFRYDFGFTPDAMDLLKWINGAFSPLAPIILEIRHRSWEHPVARDWLASIHAEIACLDYPLAANSYRLREPARGSFAYFRLHGRNREAWFAKHVQPHEPYNYDYSASEITELANESRRMLEKAKTLTIVANNHYRGKAVSAALRLKAELLQQKVPVPPALTEAFPALAAIGSQVSAGEH